MDRRVKERLIGATILVVLIVLIVPELLSGPQPRSSSPSASLVGAAEPVRNVTVDLATSKATPAEDVAASAPTPASSPAPTAAPAAAPTPTMVAASAAAGTTASAIATLRAQPVTPKLENPASIPRSRTSTPKTPSKAVASRHWSVQLGSFASRANADNLMRSVKSADAPAYVSSSGKGAQLRYRVRVGPLTDRGAAERALVKLKNKGLPASLVPP